jgi:hypothetical protein
MAISTRGLGVVAGLLWLMLALPLFVLPFMAVAFGSGPPIWLLAMPFIALGIATALITKPAARRPLIASVGFGLLLAVLSVLAWSPGTFPPHAALLAYAAIAALTAAISAAALATTSPGGPSRR